MLSDRQDWLTAPVTGPKDKDKGAMWQFLLTGIKGNPGPNEHNNDDDDSPNSR